MICVICGAPCIPFDTERWTHSGVEVLSQDFRHKPIPVRGYDESKV